jgi:hypothetical protein
VDQIYSGHDPVGWGNFNDCKDETFGFKNTGYFLLSWVSVIAQERPEP